MMYAVIGAVHLDLRDRSNDQRQLLDQRLARIQPKGLFFRERQLLHAEIRIEDKPVPNGEFIVVRKELFENDKPEVLGDIVLLQRWIPADDIQLPVRHHLHDDLAEHQADTLLYAETQPEFHAYDLIVHQL